MTESQNSSDDIEQNPPVKDRRSGNVFFIVTLACWLLFLYFYGGVKGPG